VADFDNDKEAYRGRQTHEDEETEAKNGHPPMTTFEASLAIVSTIVGGGIVGVPYSLLHAGIPFGIFLHIIVAISCSYSCTLYIYAKDLIPI